MLAVLLSGCLRNPFPPKAVVEEERSVVFPRFYDQPSVKLGEQGGHFELDGESLRAVLVAVQDFLPARAKDQPCASRLESQRYHLIRQGSVIFVYIYEDATACGDGGGTLDSGAKYAISAEGRILRRVFDGEPEFSPEEAVPPELTPGVEAKPGVVPGYEPHDESVTTQDGGLPGNEPGQDGGLPE